MALQTAIDKINATRKAYEDQLAELGQSLGQEVATHLGEFIPEGFVLTWTQATPSFNDGDPCRFRVRDAWLYRVVLDAEGNDPHEGDHAEDRGEDCTYLGSTSYGIAHTYGGVVREAHLIPGLTLEAFTVLSARWRSLPQDLLMRAFGDGAEVEISAGGALVRHDYSDY